MKLLHFWIRSLVDRIRMMGTLERLSLSRLRGVILPYCLFWYLLIFACVLQFTSALFGDGQLINRRVRAVRVNIVSSFYGITDKSAWYDKQIIAKSKDMKGVKISKNEPVIRFFLSMVSLHDTGNFISTKQAQIGIGITKQHSAFIPPRQMISRKNDDVIATSRFE